MLNNSFATRMLYQTQIEMAIGCLVRQQKFRGIKANFCTANICNGLLLCFLPLNLPSLRIKGHFQLQSDGGDLSESTQHEWIQSSPSPPPGQKCNTHPSRAPLISSRWRSQVVDSGHKAQSKPHYWWPLNHQQGDKRALRDRNTFEMQNCRTASANNKRP